MGIKVPDDLLILGIDNDESLCEHVEPTLSNIRPNFTEAGLLAARLLDERLSAHGAFTGERQRSFAASGIVSRQSTRRLPRANADARNFSRRHRRTSREARNRPCCASPTFQIIGKLEKFSDGNCGLSASFGNIAA